MQELIYLLYKNQQLASDCTKHLLLVLFHWVGHFLEILVAFGSVWSAPVLNSFHLSISYVV